ncbi:GerMN domain-containing protein [Paenibacillus sp.]|jgi:predicted small lipoprotein YifL|uniref:GerMN domain-containing protein n=1 Tax=Paenibacillus sp. TaxID=58172 RepID=UPI00283001E3|nr:GerMN domain-containing protein [Paenibacillus sp.]MDR0270681.1 GerMN domain-containing protein [Paenibacillus sp.]
MNKKLWCAGILALVMIASAGCGQKQPTTAPESGQVDAVTGDQQQTTDTGSENESEPKSDHLEQNVDGNPSDGSAAGEGATQGNSASGTSSQTKQDPTAKKEIIDVYYTDPQELELKKSQKEISYENETGKYTGAFKALQSSGKSELIPLWGGIELKKLEFKNGEITLDIHMPDEVRLGAGGEQFALDALTQTMFQFDQVKLVELLVDGAKVESLMGHVDLEHPLTRH